MRFYKQLVVKAKLDRPPRNPMTYSSEVEAWCENELNLKTRVVRIGIDEIHTRDIKYGILEATVMIIE